ncbi:hypothetical protein Golomagni_06863 [Golovinomyces magnicellulatus]|nr:hypothetical protein Golomagni_06863 [Golovinomyces magnicellulatus]
MDLLSTIRKTGSRGGVNFSWDEVANSSHRQNYLGHSVKAPVGRWQQGKDLTWYSKAETSGGQPGETDEERQARERKEEMRRVKEAEEDAMALALGLPPPQRNTSGANAIEVDNKRQIGPAREEGADEDPREKRGRDRSHRNDDSGRRERRKHRNESDQEVAAIVQTEVIAEIDGIEEKEMAADVVTDLVLGIAGDVTKVQGDETNRT